jgi:uncharacterized membrane protein YfcA
MDVATALGLAAAAAGGGALNAVAGGGSFLTFPALLAIGVPPVAANATSTLALWPGTLGSAWGYRSELRKVGGHVARLALVSALGAAAGAGWLLHSGDASFARAVPWLLLAATVLFASAGWLVPRLQARRSGDDVAPPRLKLLLLQVVVAVYGGYFGGGMGILMLAAFALAGIGHVHTANGLKSMLGAIINGVAVAVFAGWGPVQWPWVAVMVPGSLLGGYAGARLARRLPVTWVRWAVVATGLALSLHFFRQPR